MENINQEVIVPEKKKRGRKPKNQIKEEVKEPEPKVPKKRGRKPKGGKIISNVKSIDSDNYVKTNVVLHLKCSIDDLDNENNDELKEIQSYELNNTKTNLDFEIIAPPVVQEELPVKDIQLNTNENEEKLINIKLKTLQKQLHTNNISDKKSACFWCTFDFDSPPIYIPKFKTNNNYHVYGTVVCKGFLSTLF